MIIRVFAGVAITSIIVALAGCGRERAPNPSTKTAKSDKAPPPAVTEDPAKTESPPTPPAPPIVVAAADPSKFPDFGPAQLIKPGVKFREATLERGKLPMRIWYYEPENAADKLALVLVPPAGSTLYIGMELSEGDRTEHYPYVEAGFAVASFDIDGHVPNLQFAGDEAVLQGARAFREAQAGLANAKAALDFVLAKAPQIDPKRIYIAGHSSAATLALLEAEHEPRIKACVAYAPVTDVESYLAQATPGLERALPGMKDFLRSSAPKTHADKLKCPVFLFHAQDDGTVPFRHSTDFAAHVKGTNQDVTLITTAKGGHYIAMLREGIPKGITWLQKRQ
jgi:dipeptidyl aminopeptidase/acylaminoacyl peptidase